MIELTIEQAIQKGIAAHQNGRVRQAYRHYTAVLNIQPKHPHANHNLGVLAASIGKSDDALPLVKAAIEADPTIAQFWITYINILIKLNRLTEAKTALQQAKACSPDASEIEKFEKRLIASSPCYPSDLFDGRTTEDTNTAPAEGELLKLKNLFDQGHLKIALDLSQALTEKYPESAPLLNIRGILLRSAGQVELSIQAYNEALSIRPNYPEALNNLGVSLKSLGKVEEAIEAYVEAIRLRANYFTAYNNLGNALKHAKFSEPSPNIESTIISMLEHQTGANPADIAKSGISLLQSSNELRQLFSKTADATINQTFEKTIGLVADTPLLMKLMCVTPLPEINLERQLKQLRSCILASIREIPASPKLLKFQIALALQCFTNEYIYDLTASDLEAVKLLEEHVKEVLDHGQQPQPQVILCLASFKALFECDWAKHLHRSPELEDVMKRQVFEPLDEEKLKFTIPRLSESDDPVSLKVREQYENYPYPRWVNLGFRNKSLTISQMVRESNLKLFDKYISQVDSPEILIAGCGTGQHSIGTAAQFENSKVLGLDLSLSSLAYAKRKTQELRIENIDYIQGDILELKQLRRQFDVIECAGVLHHMDNPMDGWKVLVEMLRPGGLMRIGLYSETGRLHIGKIREENEKLTPSSKEKSIRAIRQSLIESGEAHHKLVTASTDFFSLSALKDLIFHEKEHHFTISQIRNSLNALGLEFCGFETSVADAFKVEHPEPDAVYDLAKWEAFEQMNPRIFASMYQFWCQKR